MYVSIKEKIKFDSIETKPFFFIMINHYFLHEFSEKDTMEVWVNGVVVETAVSMNQHHQQSE